MDLAHDQLVHIRIIIGIVTGPSVTRLLTGLFSGRAVVAGPHG